VAVAPLAKTTTQTQSQPPAAIAISPALGEPRALAPSVRAPIEGPHIIYIQQDKDWRLVADVEREVPFIAVNGKTERAEPTGRDLVSPTLPSLSGNGFILQPAKLFYPAVIRVDHIATRILAQQAERIVKTRMSLSFRASFNASAPIKRAFLALEVISKSGNHRFYLHELGDLQPNHLQYLSVDQVFGQGYEPVDYKIHIFTGGLEIMNSLMSREEIEHGLSDLVAFQLQNSPSEKPVPLLAPPPIYPPELKEKISPVRSS
jgi:hypothetical protein